MSDIMLEPRSRRFLILVGLVVGCAYVALTFNLKFLEGVGPFWKYPVGPWLLDPGDLHDNVDILDYVVAYTGLVQSPWHLPLFHVAAIGAPAGTNVVFLDVIPVVALIGRIISTLSGTFVFPYGAWVGACFILTPVFAVLVVVETGQRSLLAAVAASVLAVSAPPLLHRFGHLPLLAHFLVLGALYLYLREKVTGSRLASFAAWSAWISLALLTNAYLFAMVSAIYAASFLRSWRLSGLSFRRRELVGVGMVITLLLFSLGFIGSGAALSGGGYGLYSMNLLSPFLPQRSGVFPWMAAIVDATDGQYEGFNYLGLGGLILLLAAIVSKPTSLWRTLVAHRELMAVMLFLTLFAISNHIYFGTEEVAEFNIGWKLSGIAGIFRSSGRMFLPVYYLLLLGSLAFVLANVQPSWRLPLVAACCVLQLIDAEPLRARMASLSTHGGTPLLDQAEWSKRIARSDFVEIHPTFFCSGERSRTVDMELQVLAIRDGKAFNVAYNPRLSPDCEAEAGRFIAGPWSPTTLYVLLDEPGRPQPDWAPKGLACTEFPEGKWCLGSARADATPP